MADRDSSSGLVRLSVCTPTFQGLERLRKTAPVLLEGLAHDDELIYVVDGSTDGSLDFLEALARADSRVRVINLVTNGGRTAAVNAGCRAARGRVVTRVDDDILVPAGFGDHHLGAIDGAPGCIGAVQRVIDVSDPPPSPMWRAFVERNSAHDQALSVGDGSAPANSWGAVCSIERTIGEQLGWYDERFSAYGWEDIEFGYRLIGAGVSLCVLDGEPLQHLAAATTFADKLDRGFQAGARMALFATIHGTSAVLEALGVEPSSRQRPVAPTGVLRRMVWRGGPARGALSAVARLGEFLFRISRWRRGYDGWVARWLTWSYASGWADECTRSSLPAIPAPTVWKGASGLGAREAWCSLRTAAGAVADAWSARSLLRSAFLRERERRLLPPAVRWRRALGAVRRALAVAMGSGVRSAGANRAHVLVLIEEPTPSFTRGPLSVVSALEAADITVSVLCASDRVREHVRLLGRECESIDDLRGDGNPVSGFVRGLRTGVLGVTSLTEALGRGPWDAPARLQLTAECALYAALRARVRASGVLESATCVVSASEYFASSVALMAECESAGIPWVTLQHGTVNELYAPFFADRYIAWSSAAQAALTALEPTARSSVTISRLPVGMEIEPSSTGAVDVEVASWTGPVLLAFTQSHGPEFSSATHFDLAGQLVRLLDACDDLLVVVKPHPSEVVSAYDTLRAHERVMFVDAATSAADVARHAGVAVALGSTALLDAQRVGCVAVEAVSDESLTTQHVSCLRPGVVRLATTVLPLLIDAEARADARVRQEAAARDLMGSADDGDTIVTIVSELMGAGNGAS
ncbi:MAG: glycosyltransferase family 2 protein [Coriobacteriia bacterium]|nr:glycosyltransferase family 2 protein [Coriobacteriia bacterium]